MKKVKSFTLIELIMVIVIIGIIAAIAVPRFVNMRQQAENARREGNIGALRSGISIYYSKTALPNYEYLCTNPCPCADTSLNGCPNPTACPAGNPSPCNIYRVAAAASGPCYPANTCELESILAQPPEWGSSGSGAACYCSTGTGAGTVCAACPCTAAECPP